MDNANIEQSAIYKYFFVQYLDDKNCPLSQNLQRERERERELLLS